MKTFRQPGVFPALLGALATLAVTPAHALVITATQDANTLVGALLGDGGSGIIVTGVTLNGQSQLISVGPPGSPTGSILSSGTFTNASGTYGIGPGVVLSSGGVDGLEVDGVGTAIPGYEDGPNTDGGNGWPYGQTFPPTGEAVPGVPATAAQELLLDPITARPDLELTFDHFDVTELVIDFDMHVGFSEVSFNVVFGSEEYDEYVDSDYIDGFGMFLNGTNVAFSGGQPINIRHPDMAFLDGTELDGILAPGGNPLLVFTGLVNPTGNQLRFIVADTSDGILDTTVYLSSLDGVIPAPPAAWLAATALAACIPRLRRRR
jgi:hypothetical protein